MSNREHRKDESTVFKLRIAGDTLEAFIARHGFKKSKPVKCVVCKKEVGVFDFYVLPEGYAVIDYAHDGCKNNPATLKPIGKTKEEWVKLIGGI